jgi:hypothetical protein
VVAAWTDEVVARRWLTLFPKRRKQDGLTEVHSKHEISVIVNDPEVRAERHRRLSDVSWWMRCTADNIARRANFEDECTGPFWERRFPLGMLAT